MAQRARDKPNRSLYGILPWALAVATLYVLLTVVSRTPRLFRIGLGLGPGLVIDYVLPGGPGDVAGLALGVFWWLGTLLRRGWPLVAVFVIVVGPWFVWSPAAMFDDIWRWSSGTAETPYQIRGWGLSNFVLAFSLVPNRLAYWPFWLTEIVIVTPILVALLFRQVRHNTLGTTLYHYVLLLFAFFYASRFLNENYLGYLLAFFAMAYFSEE